MALDYARALLVLRPAFVMAKGREPTGYELVWPGAVAAAETSFGQGWVKPNEACKGSNNWGAVQAVGSQPACQGTDTMPDRKSYAQGFRVYASPEEGAADAIKRVFASAGDGILANPKTTSYEFSRALRRGTYYGGWCDRAVATFGKAAAKLGVPKNEAELACEAEAVDTHVKWMRPHVEGLSMALGMPPPPMGSPNATEASPIVRHARWALAVGAGLLVGGGVAVAKRAAWL